MSTTLLGQIDASIGGKNGINFGGLKNLIGTINQPEFIISDLSTLNTLPQREIINGMAELIKTSLIADKNLFEFIESNYDNILTLKSGLLDEIVYTASKIKADIVQQDEKEKNIRRILNFGHTFGHAIEATTSLSHGESVSLGMLKSLQISVDKFGLNKSILTRVRKLLNNSNLPVDSEYDNKKLYEALLGDKKIYTNKIKFVFLKDIAEPIIQDIEIQELREYI